MKAFFGTPWADLTLGAVEAFLADAGDEGLTWEAKGGGQAPRKESIRKAVCGFANAVGGFLIIGAERDADGWSVRGVDFPVAEPGTWLSSVLTEGLSPRPVFDVKVFACTEGRHAAVVTVDELGAPPCVTATGIVYQRVTGQTLPVTDQRVLNDLVARGRGARSETESLALRTGLRALQEPALLPAHDALVSVTLTPVSGAEDRASVLFSQPFAQRLSTRVQRDSNRIRCLATP